MPRVRAHGPVPAHVGAFVSLLPVTADVRASAVIREILGATGVPPLVHHALRAPIRVAVPAAPSR